MRSVAGHLLWVGLALAAGCASNPAPEARYSPTLDELPAEYVSERVMPIRTGVVGVGDQRPMPRYVPEFVEPRPTPAEQAFLDKTQSKGQKEDTIDFLALYRRQPGPDQGVSPERYELRVGEYGMAGPVSGFAASSATYGTLPSRAGATVSEYPGDARVSGMLPGWMIRPIGVGPRSQVFTGEDGKREIAGKHRHVNE